MLGVSVGAVNPSSDAFLYSFFLNIIVYLINVMLFIEFWILQLSEDGISYLKALVHTPDSLLCGHGAMVIHLNNMIFQVLNGELTHFYFYRRIVFFGKELVVGTISCLLESNTEFYPFPLLEFLFLCYFCFKYFWMFFFVIWKDFLTNITAILA